MKHHAYQAMIALPIVLVICFSPPAVAQETESAGIDQPQATAAAIPPDEQPFWDSAQAFVDAYAEADAATHRPTLYRGRRILR